MRVHEVVALKLLQFIPFKEESEQHKGLKKTRQLTFHKLKSLVGNILTIIIQGALKPQFSFCIHVFFFSNVTILD